MNIVKLPSGEEAPLDSDCISIERTPEGTYLLTGSLLTDEESVAMVGPGNPHATAESAEAEGMAWAAENDVETLYVSSLD